MIYYKAGGQTSQPCWKKVSILFLLFGKAAGRLEEGVWEGEMEKGGVEEKGGAFRLLEERARGEGRRTPSFSKRGICAFFAQKKIAQTAGFVRSREKQQKRRKSLTFSPECRIISQCFMME